MKKSIVRFGRRGLSVASLTFFMLVLSVSLCFAQTVTPAPGLDMTFDQIVAGTTGSITSMGLWPFVAVGLVVGLVAIFLRAAKRAGK